MKYLLMLLICLLTIYAPLELTRVIVINALVNKIWAIPAWQFILEISLQWALYVTAMIIVYTRIR